MSWLDNKSVIISGANSGLGKEIAAILITKYNCKVIGIGRQEKKFLQFAESLGDKSHMLSYMLFDVGHKENWDEMALKLSQENGQIDMLINCAGELPKFSKFMDFDTDDFERVMKTNYYSCVYSIKALLPLLEKSTTPAIINISSSAALCTLAGTAPYSASKSAQKSLTESLVAEYKNIYISNIMPGFTKTEIFRNQTNVKNKWVDAMSASPQKMAKKIVRAIRRRKKRKVLGLDAKLMHAINVLFPSKGGRICGYFLKKFKIELFKDVF